jgi:DNA-binding transcriptional MerR regulator
MTDPAVPTESPEIAEPPEIPDKLFFRIGEVAALLAVEPYVLRYWETEFPRLAPKKSGTGHRLYRRKDVELLLKIKHLLYDKRYTIEGARQSLLNDSKAKASKPPLPNRKQGDLFMPDPLVGIRTELASILKILK